MISPMLGEGGQLVRKRLPRNLTPLGDAQPMIGPPPTQPPPAQVIPRVPEMNQPGVIPPVPGTVPPTPTAEPGLSVIPRVPPPTVPQPGLSVIPKVPLPAAPQAEDFMSSFGPGNDLQGTQINPAPTGRLQQAQGMVDSAQAKLAGQPGFTAFKGVSPNTAPGFNGIAPTPGFAPAADTARVRQLTAEGVEGLTGAPSRQQIATDTYDRLEKSSLADANAATRAAFQRNAAGGRLGSGMLDEDVGDIFGQRKISLANARAGLASDTAGMELDDRLKKLSAVQNAGSQFEGQDLNRAGFDQGLRSEGRTERGQGLDYATGLRDEARGERSTQRDFETGDLNRARNLLSDQSGIEAQQTANERANRGEVRGERDFQTGRSDKAQSDRIQQRMLEDQLLNSGFSRDVTRANFDNRAADAEQENANASGDAGAALIEEIMRSGQAPGMSAEEIRKLLQGG